MISTVALTEWTSSGGLPSDLDGWLFDGKPDIERIHAISMGEDGSWFVVYKALNKEDDNSEQIDPPANCISAASV